MSQAAQHPDSGDMGNIAGFALMHPIRFFEGMEKAVPAVTQAYPDYASKVYEEAQKPSLTLPRMDTSQPGMAGVAAAPINTLEKIAEGFTAPAMLPMLSTGAVMAPLAAEGVPAAQFALRSLGAYFAATSIKTAAQQAATAGATLATPEATPGQKVEAVLDPLASAAMGLAAGKT